MSAKSGRWRRIGAALGALVVLAAALAAVAYAVVSSGAIPALLHPAPVSFEATTPVKPPAMPKTMPNVLGKDVESVARQLTALGVTVHIVLPARHTGLYNGAQDSSETTELVLPEVRVVFSATGTPSPPAWDHAIARQQPDAGVPLDSGVRVVLYAGKHRGGTTTDGWFDGHVDAVGSVGPSECLRCHTYQECLDCHLVYRPDQSIVDSSAVGTSAP
jgi:hypothetical protein